MFFILAAKKAEPFFFFFPRNAPVSGIWTLFNISASIFPRAEIFKF